MPAAYPAVPDPAEPLRLVERAGYGHALAAGAARPVVTSSRDGVGCGGPKMLRIPVEAGYGGPLFPAGIRAMAPGPVAPEP